MQAWPKRIVGLHLAAAIVIGAAGGGMLALVAGVWPSVAALAASGAYSPT